MTGSYRYSFGGNSTGLCCAGLGGKSWDKDYLKYLANLYHRRKLIFGDAN